MKRTEYYVVTGTHGKYGFPTTQRVYEDEDSKRYIKVKNDGKFEYRCIENTLLAEHVLLDHGF